MPHRYRIAPSYDPIDLNVTWIGKVDLDLQSQILTVPSTLPEMITEPSSLNLQVFTWAVKCMYIRLSVYIYISIYK